MRKLNKYLVKATVINLIVALIFMEIIWFTIKFTVGERISTAISLANLFITNENEIRAQTEDISFNLEKNTLKNYPSLGEKYGTLTIDSLNVKLALYFGDSLEILRKGVGHSTYSYFPGEGGSIICMAHDTEGFLKYLYTISENSIIEIETTYGKFKYQLYETKIIHQSEVEALFVQKDEEILILYTCYPSNSIGHATHRFITYSKLIEKEIY